MSLIRRILFGGGIAMPILLSVPGYAEIVDPAPENLIFEYDVDPGTLFGNEAYNGLYLGSVDAYDYRQSTTSFWVNIESINSAWGGMLQVGNEHEERRPGFWLRPDETTLYYTVQTGNHQSTLLSNNIALPLGEWINITATMNNGTSKLYYDGNLVVEGDVAVEWPRDFEPSWEVHTARTTSGSVNGRIDDVRIYDRALNETEIEQMMYNSRYVDVPVPYMISALGLFFAVRNRRK